MDSSIDRLRPSDVLTICVLALLGTGIVMVQSAAMSITGEVGLRWSDRGTRHAIFAAVGLIVYFLVARVDHRRLLADRRVGGLTPAGWLMALSVVLCVIVLIPGIGISVNGARRWLPLGVAQVQPSEIAKWSAVVYLAALLCREPFPLQRFGGFLRCLAPIALACAFIATQDFGTAALVALASLIILLTGRTRWWHLLVTLPPALLAAAAFIVAEPYRLRRMTSFLDPWAAPRGEGYHMVQSLLSFATGGLSGRGLGNGVQKLDYLPEDTTDFIFAVICEELGFFGAALVVLMFLGIFFVALRTLRGGRGDGSALLAFGIAAMIGLQAIINIAVATVSVPTKGLSLPLISAGGSGLIVTCAALGLLCNVVRSVERQDAPTAPAAGALPRGLAPKAVRHG